MMNFSVFKPIKLSFAAMMGLFTALSISACSVLPDPAPADTVYRLTTAPNSVASDVDAAVIRIDRPSAPIVFQNRDVVVSPDGQRLASASQAKWSEITPILVQNSFVEILSAREDLIGVLPSSGARTDTRVQLTIKNFEAQFDQGSQSAPKAVVRYSATFANASDRSLIGTYEITKMKRANAASVSSIVEAISAANREALSDISDWLAIESQKLNENQA
ncbi:ABC-type transport auxiliary lipoprotein family protein [Litorimonas haliclonae]|uniref:ABC-type transport auxiliary lipoprotein family protein n=1 Tax=Litorimonas haliclonae TaxID=2081977 RepID=UPI0039EE3708